MEKKGELFAQGKINTGRQLEIDMARGLAVLFMIIIHVQIYFANPVTTDSYLAGINDFLGDIPAAPMFMFLLGVGINYSRKNDAALTFKRGIGLLVMGYALNLIRGLVPGIIRAYTYWDVYYLYEGIEELLYVDILQFAGLAMMLFGVFKYLKLQKVAIGLTGIGLALLNFVMLPQQTETLLASAITGLFWGSHESIYFPFLTWIFYPIAGYLFGSYLIRCSDKKRFYQLSAIWGTLIFIVGTYYFNEVLGIPSGLATDTGYYHHILTDNITFTAFVIVEIAVLSFLIPFIPKVLLTIAKRWSKNVTSLYCIHWVIITWLALVIPMGSLKMAPFIVLVGVIVGVSDVIAYFYGQIKQRRGR
ncbi:MAG: heparan-alpha-glucosaminide N-acetyltransferase domain-containing protein [Cellulosilyticaceae bacterium]